MTIETTLLNDWHVVGELEMLLKSDHHTTALFEIPLRINANNADEIVVIRTDNNQIIPSQIKYEHVWVCLGSPEREIVTFPEAEELDRYCVSGGSIAVHVSGLRVVENFLDLGHLPFVHANYLGSEPYTEVNPYEVSISEHDEVVASNCLVFQPYASPGATDGYEVGYAYKVMRPFLVVLYKSNPIEEARMDFIALMVQPVSEERCVAHPFLAYLKHNINEADIRWFMQLIFAQDKPILENQHPKRLPLDPRAEMPVRADASSIAYRRWLQEHGVTYGAIQSGFGKEIRW